MERNEYIPGEDILGVVFGGTLRGKVATAFSASGGEPYVGEYEVTPRLIEQTLLTKNKIMREDMVIKTIPITTVGNNSGGNTVIIGE
jgi:hypothetical protein